SSTQTLSGANTYFGCTTISKATLRLGTSLALPPGNVSANGTLDLNGFSATIVALSGSGTVTSSVAGAVDLSIGNSFSSGTFAGRSEDRRGGEALTTTGSEALVHSSANTYTASTTIRQEIR